MSACTASLRWGLLRLTARCRRRQRLRLWAKRDTDRNGRHNRQGSLGGGRCNHNQPGLWVADTLNRHAGTDLYVSGGTAAGDINDINELNATTGAVIWSTDIRFAFLLAYLIVDAEFKRCFTWAASIAPFTQFLQLPAGSNGTVRTALVGLGPPKW